MWFCLRSRAVHGQKKRKNDSVGSRFSALWLQRGELCYPEMVRPEDFLHPGCLRSGRSAAWLARLVRDQEAGGSNPLAPTNLFNDLSAPSGFSTASLKMIRSPRFSLRNFDIGCKLAARRQGQHRVHFIADK